MPPDTQQPAPNPNDPNNRYDFILKGETQKKSWFSTSSMGVRIALVVGGLSIILILFIMILSTLIGSGKPDSQSLAKIAEQQQALIAIAQIGNEKASTSSVRVFAATTEVSLSTAQADLLNFLAKNGRSIKSANLEKDINPAIEATLDKAEQNNNLDNTVTTLLQDGLLEYQQSLKSAHDSTGHTETKQLLSKQFEQASTLLKAPERTE